MTDLIQEVREALAKATPGPWEWRKKNFTPGDGEWKDKEFCVGDLRHETKRNSWDSILDVQINKYGQPDLYCWDDAAAHIIANAPTWLQQLTDRLEAAEREWDEAVKALEWYADLESYKGVFQPTGIQVYIKPVETDKGELARKTLERIKSTS